MYDVERIGKIISDIERYFRDLEGLNIKNVEDLEDRKDFYAISMVLFSILNRAIDLGDEIVMANNLGMPSTYKEIFRLLTRNKYIGKDMGEELSNLVFYRNLLSHEYYDLTEEDVLEVFKKISIVKKFVERIKEVLKE
ncbi:MAG: hypothetical protein BA871_16240 [Desulfuromonadales bacterium C00003096]|nr:MAG: hypothetical protein BA871_16240 [Desulfuromonadales bacterium C00003096]